MCTARGEGGLDSKHVRSLVLFHQLGYVCVYRVELDIAREMCVCVCVQGGGRVKLTDGVPL